MSSDEAPFAAETAKDASFPDTGDAEEADDLFADYHPQAADKDLSQSFPEMEDGDATETFLETQLEKSGEELDLEKELEKEVDAAMEELSPAAAEVDVADKGATKPTMAQGTATLETELEKSGEDLDLEKELEKVMEAAMRGPDEESDLEKELERVMEEELKMDEDLRTPSKEARRAADKESPPKASPPKEKDVDETRFTLDKDGNRVHKWKVDYAARAGGGRAMCRDSQCLERCEQAGVAVIEKGALRIGRRVLDKEGNLMILWHHARCMFNVFTRSRKNTRIIESTEDLEGFELLRPEDQELLRGIISGSEDLRGARFLPAGPNLTGKRGLGESDGPAGKRRKELEEKAASVNLHKGDRVWTRCWVRVAQPGPEGGMDMPQKSKKPELGMIAEESEDGNFFVIQFESKEHELERLAMLEKKRYRRIRPWLRYPRFFEGKTQKIKRDWIQTSRPPPRLCSCKRQEWGHECPCGITCKRVSRPDVWGVDQ